MKVKIGLLYDWGEDGYVGLLAPDNREDWVEGEDVELELTDDEFARVRAAIQVRTKRFERAVQLREEADRLEREAEQHYDEGFQWLADRRTAAIKALEDAEKAEFERQQQEAKEARRAALAAEDAELGPRLFVWVRMTDSAMAKADQIDASREESTARVGGKGLSDKYKVIHRRDCKSLESARNSELRTTNGAYEVARKAQDLRMDPAITMYLAGAKTCGVCKPDEQMVEVEESGELVRAERLKRESAPVTIALAALVKAVKEIGMAWSEMGRAGFNEVASNRIQTAPGERIVGWRNQGDKFISPIPEHSKDEVFEHLSGKFGWTVRWSNEEAPGYLIVGQLNAAQKRELRETK